MLKNNFRSITGHITEGEMKQNEGGMEERRRGERAEEERDEERRERREMTRGELREVEGGLSIGMVDVQTPGMEQSGPCQPLTHEQCVPKHTPLALQLLRQ